jgi:hypothetical protein
MNDENSRDYWANRPETVSELRELPEAELGQRHDALVEYLGAMDLYLGRTAGLWGDSPSSLRSSRAERVPSLYGRLQLGYARCQGGVDPPVLPVGIALLVELPA